MAKKFESVRGMSDILPKDVWQWQAFEAALNGLLKTYGYQEIRLPHFEFTGLFTRSIGEVTDIVEKEMYTFKGSDDAEEGLTLRPEGTAGCVRAGIEHGLLYHQIQRLWYMGAMFRKERPQKGRLREFHQVGVEAFGLKGPEIEVEQLLMTARLWRLLGISEGVSLQINSLGSLESRQHYRTKLVEYFSRYLNDLDTDSQRRLQSNPLRILDSKNPKMASIIEGAPKCYAHLDSDSKTHFELLQGLLSDLAIPYELNPNLVRGLDYYNRTVYEWVTDKLGAQGTICAGGRYDSLVEALGGESTPAVGFAMGVERVLLLQTALLDNPLTAQAGTVDVYFVYSNEPFLKEAFLMAEQLRKDYPALGIMVHCDGGSLKQQFKRADKSGARFAIVLGEAEMQDKKVGVKFLRENSNEQSLVGIAQLGDFLKTYFVSM